MAEPGLIELLKKLEEREQQERRARDVSRAYMNNQRSDGHVTMPDRNNGETMEDMPLDGRRSRVMYPQDIQGSAEQPSAETAEDILWRYYNQQRR